MANKMASLPWVLDTPSATALTKNHLKIDHVEYVGYLNPNDTVELQDLNGQLVALLRGNQDLDAVSSWEQVGWITGLILPLVLTAGGGTNMPSGKLIIYLN